MEERQDGEWEGSEDVLEELRETVRENNKILRSMRRDLRFRRILSFLYFLIILASLFFTYYYLEPYLHDAANIYSQGIEKASSTNALLHDFLNKK